MKEEKSPLIERSTDSKDERTKFLNKLETALNLDLADHENIFDVVRSLKIPRGDLIVEKFSNLKIKFLFKKNIEVNKKFDDMGDCKVIITADYYPTCDSLNLIKRYKVMFYSDWKKKVSQAEKFERVYGENGFIKLHKNVFFVPELYWNALLIQSNNTN